jgi:hypothetical protein
MPPSSTFKTDTGRLQPFQSLFHFPKPYISTGKCFHSLYKFCFIYLSALGKGFSGKHDLLDFFTTLNPFVSISYKLLKVNRVYAQPPQPQPVLFLDKNQLCASYLGHLPSHHLERGVCWLDPATPLLNVVRFCACRLNQLP